MAVVPQSVQLSRCRPYLQSPAGSIRRAFEHPASQIVLQDYIHAVTDAEVRVDCLSK